MYRPRDEDDNTDAGDNYPAADGRPSPVMGSTMDHVDGGDPNGTWQLRVVDDHVPLDEGVMPEGWRLTIVIPDPLPPPPPPPPLPGDGPCAGVPEDGFVDVGPENVHEATIDCLRFFG